MVIKPLRTQDSPQISFKQFVANIEIIGNHATTIKVGYEPIINVNHVQQSAIVREILSKTSRIKDDENVLHNGDRADVILEFK